MRAAAIVIAFATHIRGILRVASAGSVATAPRLRPTEE
jgi:hypothetical protein